jgi:hypothetical protein
MLDFPEPQRSVPPLVVGGLPFSRGRRAALRSPGWFARYDGEGQYRADPGSDLDNARLRRSLSRKLFLPTLAFSWRKMAQTPRADLMFLSLARNGSTTLGLPGVRSPCGDQGIGEAIDAVAGFSEGGIPAAEIRFCRACFYNTADRRRPGDRSLSSCPGVDATNDMLNTALALDPTGAVSDGQYSYLGG